METLKSLQTWVPWIKTAGHKKPSMDGRYPCTWRYEDNHLGTFAEVSEYMQEHPALKLMGIGFRVPHGYLVIDVDEPENIKRALEKFPGYAEYSPSGNGVHIIVKSNIIHKKWEDDQVEYLTERCFSTFTGNCIRDDPLENCDDRITVPVDRSFNVGVGVVRVAESTTRMGRVALDGECDRISRARTGKRTKTCYTSAKNVGELVAAGQIQEHEALRELERAADRLGLPRGKAEDQIYRGLQEGKKHPRQINDGRR